MAKIGLEDIELIKIMDFVRYHKLDDFIWHCANERVISPQGGALLKRKGVLAGVSDLIVMRPKNGFHGLFVELKVKGGKLSPAQTKFLATMEREGYMARVCWSAQEAIDLLISYLDLNIPHPHKQPHEPESQPDFLGEF